jgi:acyl-CoA hydrolase
VALDDLSRPIEVPELKIETEDEIRRFENAKKRVAMKKSVQTTLKQKN